MHESVLSRAADIVARARAQGRRALLEPEALALVDALGAATPERVFVRNAGEIVPEALEALPSDRVVVKVVAADVLHKSDAGGVVAVPNTFADVVAAVARMEERFAGSRPAGFSIHEFVPHDRSFGRELLVGIRWTEEFGPVVTLGPGGVLAEHLADAIGPSATAILSPDAPPAARDWAELEGTCLAPVLSGRLRGQSPVVDPATLRAIVDRFLEAARAWFPDLLSEFEINPLVLTDRGPAALDARGIVGRAPAPAAPPRPRAKLDRLLRPRSIAVIGVSERMNPGRRIVRNCLKEGFDPSNLWIVKPGAREIDGCPCVGSIAELPDRVDLLVLSVDAAQVPHLVHEVTTLAKAESLVVIPGGLGEREGSEGGEACVRETIARARRDGGHAPVINGGNCLGIRSKPGCYDTMFLPDEKLPGTSGPVSALAVISQSGAFAAARASRLASLNPRYLISIGNQIDLTAGDYLEALADDPAVDVFACYIEGFRPLDGARFLAAARTITAAGRTVVLYRAGRNAAGAGAAASHTASIAGDYSVTRALAESSGIVVADSLEDFDDLVRLATRLRGRRAAGWRLGAVSNAGFECVAIADGTSRFRLASFNDETRGTLSSILRAARLDAIVDVHNPLDTTPILGDEGFEAAARAILADENVDAAIVGCVPMTGALETLAPAPGRPEDVFAERSVASRLGRLATEFDKPWVAVVDAGADYDAMAAHLDSMGVPVFRAADRAVRLLEAYTAARWRAPEPALAAVAAGSRTDVRRVP